MNEQTSLVDKITKRIDKPLDFHGLGASTAFNPAPYIWFIRKVTVVTEAQMVTEQQQQQQQQHPAGEDTEAQKMTTEVFLSIRIILSINVHLVTIFSSTHTHTHPFNGPFPGPPG